MALSMLLHLLVLSACVFVFRQQLTSAFVAAGEGEGGGAGSAIEVGVIAASQLGFAKPKPISHVGEADDTTNNTVVETKRPTPPPDADVLPFSHGHANGPEDSREETDQSQCHGAADG